MELTKEMLAKAKEAKTAEELIALAKENGMELDAKKAEDLFAKLHQAGELSDDELNNVAGGGCSSDHFGGIIIEDTTDCPYCGAENTKEQLPAGGFCIHCDNCGKTTIF